MRTNKQGGRSDLASLATRNVIDSRRLFYFYHVARERSFIGAEAILDIAQPAISRQIQQLETDLGVQFLERNGRGGVSLTQYGDILYRRASGILEDMSATVEEIETARRRPTGQISIAASAGIIAIYMPEIVRRFITAFPKIQLTAIQASSGEVYDHLARGQVDVAIIQHAPGTQKLSLQKLSVEPLFLIASRKHPIAKQAFVRRESLASLELVLPASLHGMRSNIEQYCREGGLDLIPQLQVDSDSLIKAVVKSGRFCGFLPKLNCDTNLDMKEYVALPLKPALSRTLYVASLRDRANQPIVTALIRQVAEVFRDQSPQLAAPKTK
jgi:LysR family transcriptional regulator, nitrogen assimilation regulatory protein